MKKNVITIALSVLLSGLAALGIVKAAEPQYASLDGEGSSAIQTSGRTVNLTQTDYPDFTYAAETAVEAVVYVKVTVRMAQQYQQIDPFFRFFFGDDVAPQAREREQQGSGSGVIIRPDGYIVTNNHVVQDATKVEVTLNNNKTYEARVIGTDPATDVALIKIDADNLSALPFGDSDQLRLGEWVIAIGSPYDLRSTITAGIVSAKGRSIPNYDGKFKIESFIQTDAAVNPGNSGGALVNKKGELVGVNTAIISQTGSYTGYSFAVPVNIVRKIVSDLIDFGSVKRVMLGIAGGNLNEELASELKLSSLQGVYISEVQAGGAADKAGLKKDDVIVELDGVAIKEMAFLQEKVNGYHPGDVAKLTFIRNGNRKTVEVTFQEADASNGAVAQDGSVSFYGASLVVADKESLERAGVRGGVRIASLSTGKMLGAGAQEGFIIQYVNDQPVSKPQDVIEIAKKSKRAVYIEGVTATGQPAYFAFGKQD